MCLSAEVVAGSSLREASRVAVPLDLEHWTLNVLRCHTSQSPSQVSPMVVLVVLPI